MTTLPAFPSEYADLFMGRFADVPVSSPFGAWLLPALAGTLGVAAQRQASEMLSDPPEAMKVAVAAWDRRLPEVKAWIESRFPSQVQTGPIPTQADADAWAARETDGLVREFPVGVTDPLIAAVLASAVTLQTQWRKPLRLLPGDVLGGEFGSHVEQAVTATGVYGTDGGVYETRRAGLVCAFLLTGTDGVRVWSGLGEEGVPARDVTFALRDIAEGHATPVPVSSLDVGDYGSFAVEDAQDQQDRVVADLPAWNASGTFDVQDAPGFPELAGELIGLLPPVEQVGASTEAKQSAVAEFDQFGFRAAAVTAMSLRAGSAMPQLDRVKQVRLRFGRPFRVLAYGPAEDAWDDVPLFCAGVEAPAEPRREVGRARHG